jgi:pimeloyl-ACP methyl ester carboxylesterase
VFATALVAASAVLAPGAQDGGHRPGPRVETFRSDVDDTDQPYALYLPQNYDPARRYPLIVGLHAAGSDHRLMLRRIFGRGALPGQTEGEASRTFPRLPDADYIVACPLARGTMGYRGIPERDVYDVLDAVKKRYTIDDDRVFLTGIDQGGGGALWLAMTRPDVWAGVAAICPQMPEGAAAIAGNALNIPVYLYQGELDPMVPAAGILAWHKMLLDLNVRAELTEYPGIRHNAWDPAYRGGQVFRTFDPLRRNRWPRRVRFTTRQYRYAQAYWVRLDRFRSGHPASIDIQVTGRNRVEAVTSGLDAFTLNLAGHPLLTAGSPLAIVIDGTAIRARRPGDISFQRVVVRRGAAESAPVWRLGPVVMPPAGAKRAGLEGPCAEAVAGRHVYVYGTTGAGTEDELARRKAVAEQGADWASARSRLLLSLRTVPDREAASEAAAGASLVLFGTAGTNSVLAGNAARLPMALNAGAADYGLVYVYPLDGRLALINSGVPWWTAGGGLGSRLVYAPERLRSLMELRDWVLFRGSLDHVVLGGEFDDMWRLDPVSTEALRRTGAVSVVNR